MWQHIVFLFQAKCGGNLVMVKAESLDWKVSPCSAEMTSDLILLLSLLALASTSSTPASNRTPDDGLSAISLPLKLGVPTVSTLKPSQVLELSILGQLNPLHKVRRSSGSHWPIFFFETQDSRLDRVHKMTKSWPLPSNSLLWRSWWTVSGVLLLPIAG